MIESMVIRIVNFDNEAMADSPSVAVVTILKDIITKIEAESDLGELDACPLRNVNGNQVGIIHVTVIDEDDIDDEGDDEDFDEDDIE